MTKHAKNSNHLQAVDLPKTMAVEIPLTLLEAFGSIESSFFELCIDSGQQVLRKRSIIPSRLFEFDGSEGSIVRSGRDLRD
jgi:hypothetical protein